MELKDYLTTDRHYYSRKFVETMPFERSRGMRGASSTKIIAYKVTKKTKILCGAPVSGK
jgi:hypothetical protein